MNDIQIKNCIGSQRLKLSPWNKVTHFGLAGLFLLVPIILLFAHLIEYLKGTIHNYSESLILFLTITFTVGLALYFIQANRLKFHVITSKLTTKEHHDLIKQIAKSMNWIVKEQRDNLIVLDTHPSYFDWQMGDSVTIIFDAEKILINSICDPATKTSLLGVGRHRHNIRIIVDGVARASH